MKFWFDTEFIDNGKTIDLISIGIVAEDGRTYYKELSDGWDRTNASQWVVENVLSKLKSTPGYRITRKDLATELIDFFGESPEIWAYYADYDWVALCQVFGTMMDLPPSWPMYCKDLKQLLDLVGNPKRTVNHSHNALEDALWVKDQWIQLYQEFDLHVFKKGSSTRS